MKQALKRFVQQRPLLSLMLFFGSACLLYLLPDLLHLIFNLNDYLQAWSASHPHWIYALVFLIVFCETGLVFMPFLPGDSLLFALGSLAAQDYLSWSVLAVGLLLMAILGDAFNFYVGKRFGSRVLSRGWLKEAHWQRTHAFYQRYGRKTIILARFVPIVRTIAPFAAGFALMPYPVFMRYNLIGGFIWVWGLLALGYAFGNLPWVQNNFSLLILMIIFISVLPALLPFMASFLRRNQT